MATNRKLKADDNPAGPLSNAELSDKAEDEAPITLVLKWSKQPRKPGQYLETSLQSWFNTGKKGLNCSVIKILKGKNALIKIEPFPDSEILQNLSGESLTLKDDTTVTVESVLLGSPKLDTQTADVASMSSTPSTSDHNTEKDEPPITLMLKWSKQPGAQQECLEKSLQSWFIKERTGLRCSVVRILEDKNALIKIKPSPVLKILQKLSGEKLTLQNDTTVTVESVVLGSSKLDTQADEEFMTPTSSTSDISEQKRSQNDSDSAARSFSEKQIRQNQEEAVPVPVGFFWYLNQVYKEEIKRIEKENACEIEVNLNVTFKAKQKDGSQQKALSGFTNLIQNHFNESRESVIPVQNVRPEQCSEAFKLIQENEKKVLLTLTPKEITVRGPDSAQLKSVLERNAPDEKPDLLHDDTPLKMTIKDPLADAGMKMEESTWKALDVDGKITKIKEKFDVDFQEVMRDRSKVKVKASYKGPEGNPFMESNAVRALLRLYQKSITSSLNFTQHSSEILNEQKGITF